MTVEDIRLLYAYERWANARVLGAAAVLTPAQLVEDLQSSHQSVYGTLTHMLWGAWRWLARWQGQPGPSGANPRDCADFPSLRSRWREVAEAQRAFVEQVTESALERCVTYENPAGTPWTYPLGQMLQHVVNHSTYHRGQVATMLRQLGAAPAPTDFLVYIDDLQAPLLSGGPDGA